MVYWTAVVALSGGLNNDKKLQKKLDVLSVSGSKHQQSTIYYRHHHYHHLRADKWRSSVSVGGDGKHTID